MDKICKHIVILGAGKTGRGFLAVLFHRQAKITFIDRNPSLIAALRAAGSYRVRFFDNRPEEVISQYTALCTDDPNCKDILQKSDAIFVCVRPENCPAASDWLRGKISEKTCIFACENAVYPAALMGVLQNQTCSAAVFATSIQEPSSLNLQSENYPFLHVESADFAEPLYSIKGLRKEANFPLLMLRKIYTYNASSAIIAYLGAEKGISSYSEAACDPDIARELDLFYPQINRALCLEYQIDPKEQEAFSQNARRKFENHQIIDTVARNAANPERKLKPHERLIAPAKLIEKHGGDASSLYKAAAGALHYMEEIIYPDDARQAIYAICGLSVHDPISQKIMRYFY